MPRLIPFAPDVWLVEGPTVSFFSIPYPTRMVVLRLPEGLWVWSPVALDEGLRAEVDALGPVRWLVEPNLLHHLFLTPWQEAYPEAKSYAPPGLLRRKPELDFTGALGDEPVAGWGAWVDQAILGGGALFEEAVFFHRPSSTCIVGDFIQRHDAGDFTGWRRWVMAADGLLGEGSASPRELQGILWRRGPSRRALARIRAWEPQRLIIAHGACAREGALAKIEEGLGWIDRPWPL